MKDPQLQFFSTGCKQGLRAEAPGAFDTESVALLACDFSKRTYTTTYTLKSGKSSSIDGFCFPRFQGIPILPIPILERFRFPRFPAKVSHL